MARTISIEYGALRVGLTPSNAAFRLTDKYVLDISHEAFRCQFTVLITGTAANVQTAEAQLLTAMRLRDARLIVTTAAGVRHTFDPADGVNTGLLTRGSAVKPPTAMQTETSREYLCEVIGQLPEDLVARAGRREARVAVAQDASEVRTVTATGTYTASGANDAIAQYVASVDAWINAELTAIGAAIKWNTVARQYDYEDRKKLLTFNLAYQEIIHDESQAGRDHASLTNQRIFIRRAKFGDARSPVFGDARPLELIEISYSANVRQTQTPPSGLVSLYENTIRPHLLAQVPDGLIIVREEPIYGPDGNTIQARLLCRALKSGIIEARVQLEQANDPGEVLLPAIDGNPFSKRRYQGFANEVWTVRVQMAVTRGTPMEHERAIPGQLLDESRYIRIFAGASDEDTDFGTSDGSVILMSTRSSLFVFVRAEEPETGAAEGGESGEGQREVAA